MSLRLACVALAVVLLSAMFGTSASLSGHWRRCLRPGQLSFPAPTRHPLPLSLSSLATSPRRVWPRSKHSNKSWVDRSGLPKQPPLASCPPSCPRRHMATSSEKMLISQLLLNFKKTSEVRQYLKYFGSAGRTQFAIIRVSGDTLGDPELLKQVASALSFLHRVGLVPVVLHGAGVFTGRRNQELASRFADADSSGKEIMQHVAQVLEAENHALVAELQALGAAAKSLTSGVFRMQSDPSYAQHEVLCEVAGVISGVSRSVLTSAIQNNLIPVVSSMGVDYGPIDTAESDFESDSEIDSSSEDSHSPAMPDSIPTIPTGAGRLLTVSTTVATRALAEVLQPLKVVTLRTEGSIKVVEEDEKPHRVVRILTKDITELLPKVPSADQGELTFASSLFEVLPTGSTVAITQPRDLAQELFTTGGAGTLVARGEAVYRITDINDPRMDFDAITGLLEEAFKAKLPENYFDKIKPDLRAIYLCESGRGVAIVTTRVGVAYLDKFAVSPNAQGDKLGDMLWREMIKQEPILFWRSRSLNQVNGWYYEHACGAHKAVDWHVFWVGLPPAQVSGVIEHALQIAPTFVH